MAAHKEEHAKLQYRDRSELMGTHVRHSTTAEVLVLRLTTCCLVRNLRACSIPSSLPIADWNL